MRPGVVKCNYRSCDSRNLNISPFCILERRQNPNPWAEDVNDLYNAWAENEDDLKLSYLPEKGASYRKTYPLQDMKDNELLTTRPKVNRILWFFAIFYIFRKIKIIILMREICQWSTYILVLQLLLVTISD